MGTAQGRLGEFLLRYASPLAGLRRVPVLGRCVSWAGEKLVPRGSRTWVQVRNGAAKGLWLNLNPRTGQAYFDGGGELEVQAALENHVRPGMTVYDVGANIGLYSMIAARLVGDQGHVVAFEADPEIAARLREHLARNGFRQAIVEEAAVWSEAQRVYFERADPAASPDRGLGRVVEAGKQITVEVNAVALDEYVQTHAAPDFVKCDVEGAEIEVFRGARQLLREKRPVIVCEMHSEANRRSLTAEFTNLRYSCTPCGTNHVLAVPS